MFNDQGSKVPVRPGYGPGYGTGRPPAGQSMSRSRAHVLGIVQAQPEATTLAALISATGLHANTIREHLVALVQQGLVQRHRATPAGRGRPAWLYTASPADLRPEQAEYAGLAAALASTLHRTSADPRADAMVSGAEWGRELAHDHGVRQDVADRAEPSAARRQVVDLLDHIGFAPEPDAEHTVVRLTRCPLLEAAHRYPDVVCAVHLGIVRGALEEYGADPGGTDLFPFSEPGACRLELLGVGAASRP